MVALVDTNVLVYRHDPRDRDKQRTAWRVVTDGLESNSIRVAYQAVVEFFSVVTRPLRDIGPLLNLPDATREAEEILASFDVLYPSEEVVRTALRGTATYQLPWYDALMWAYAETNGLNEILSEDLHDGRMYGRVRIVNPFR